MHKNNASKYNTQIKSHRGIDFLNQIVLKINEEIGSDYTFVGKSDSDFKTIETISLCKDNELIPNFSYNTLGTPCKDVLNSEICFYHENTQDIFPKDELLVQMGINGYIGYPLFALDGKKIIGVIVSLFKNKIDNYNEVLNRFKLIAPRIELELDRLLLSSEIKEAETQNKELNKNLAQTKEMLSEAYQLAKIGAWDIDLKENKTYWSKTAKEILEVSPDFIPKMEDSILFYKEGKCRDTIKNAIVHSLKTGADYNVVAKVITYKGKEITARFIGKAVIENGVCVRFYGTFQDITAKVKAQQLLENSEEKFRAISNQTTEGITVADLKGNYVFVNPAFCKMSGYSEEELLKLTVFGMKAKGQDHSSFNKSQETKEGTPIRVNLKRKNGTEYLTEIIGDVIQIDNKSFVLGTIRNITKQVEFEKTLQEQNENYSILNKEYLSLNEEHAFQNKLLIKVNQEIKTLNENLEQVVKERTQKLNKTVAELNTEIEQRITFEKEIQDALHVKEVLLKEVTHRVKNNLQIISSLINLQKNTIKNKDSVALLSSTVNRIHSMSLIHETLYRSNNFGEIKFKDYIQSLILYIGNTFNTSHITLDINIGDFILPIDAANNCGMIVMELITNSVKYAFPNQEEGKISVTMESINATDYQLIVADNGIGYPKDFDFHTTHSLGFQLITSLIEQVNGTIQLIEGKGAGVKILVKEI